MLFNNEFSYVNGFPDIKQNTCFTPDFGGGFPPFNIDYRRQKKYVSNIFDCSTNL